MSSRSPSTDAAMSVHAPTHPVPQLQGPFEESMLESVNDMADEEAYLDASERRATLLEKPLYERVCAGRWKQKPGEKYHPLWKIASQMSFGMHLLAEGMARSEDDVMKILQAHVDDVDSFLERTSEDFDLALSDIKERLHYLRLPLEHTDVFDRMLEDRIFRASIVDGNEKIEHIGERTSKSIRDAMTDVQKGLDATRALGRYLDDLEPIWDRQTAEHEAVFVAMLGNVEGWARAFMALHLQGNRLKVVLVDLSETVSEMMRRAAVISRKSARQTQLAAPVMQQMTGGDARQRSSRKSRAQGSSAEHNPSRSSTYKALPSAPDSRRKSRPAEKSRASEGQKPTDTPHNLNSKQKSSTNPGASSSFIPAVATDPHDSCAKPFSPGSTSSKAQTPSNANILWQQNSREKFASPRIMLKKQTQPIELPADVPQAALLQAPLSKENRRSMNLEPKISDPAEHGISRRLSNRVLASLLKSPLSTRLSRTPQSVNSGKTNESYTTTLVSPSGHQAEYFWAADPRRTVMIEEDAKMKGTGSGSEKAVQGLGIGSHTTETAAHLNTMSSRPQSSSSTSHSPEKRTVASPLASHPPDMEMATSPYIKHHSIPAKTIPSSVGEAVMPSHNRFSDQTVASLGEPGPEVDDAEPPDLATLMQGNEHARTFTTVQPVLSVDLPTTELQPKPRTDVSSNENDSISAINEESVDDEAHKDAPTPLQENPRPLVAELEGDAPIPFRLQPQTEGERSHGPAELEAPVQHSLTLPPRHSALSTQRACEGSMTSATIATQSDFFKMPPAAVTPGIEYTDPKVPSVSALGQQGRPSIPPNDHQWIDRPPTMLSRTILGRPAANRMASLQTADILEQLSSTPPGSPIHTRSSSEMSASSAQQLSGSRFSIGFNNAHPVARFHEAPPPPAPGGRSMVSPNFAVTGMFEGEKKPRHIVRSSVGNQTSWKKVFGAASNYPLSATPGTPRSKSTSFFDAKIGNPEVHEEAQAMLDSAGNDVLWFKGMTRDGIWVSTASGAH